MTHRRPRRLPATLLPTLVLGLTLTAACSPSTPAASSSSVPTTAAPAADPATTPLAPSSSLPSTSTPLNEDEDEDAVRQIHTRFMTELAAIDERIAGPESRIPLIEELTTGAQETRMKDAIAASLESGERLVSPGYVSNILSVEIEGDRAEVRDCSLGRGELYSSDDQLLSPTADTFGIRTTVLVRVDGRWLVEDFLVGDLEPCEPPVGA